MFGATTPSRSSSTVLAASSSVMAMAIYAMELIKGSNAYKRSRVVEFF